MQQTRTPMHTLAQNTHTIAFVLNLQRTQQKKGWKKIGKEQEPDKPVATALPNADIKTGLGI